MQGVRSESTPLEFICQVPDLSINYHVQTPRYEELVHNRFVFTRSLPDAVPKMKFRNFSQACWHRRKWIYEIWLAWLTWPYFISQRQPMYVVKIQDHQYVRTYCTHSPSMRGERVQYVRGVQKPEPECSNKTSYLTGPSRSLSLKAVIRPYRSQDLWDMSLKAVIRPHRSQDLWDMRP